jgi:hypothetical protein
MTEKEFANTLSFLEEAWEQGAKEAVALAVSLCSTQKQPPPYWVTLAVACLVSPRYQHDKRLANEGAACAPSAVRESYESVQKQLGSWR